MGISSLQRTIEKSVLVSGREGERRAQGAGSGKVAQVPCAEGRSLQCVAGGGGGQGKSVSGSTSEMASMEPHLLMEGGGKRPVNQIVKVLGYEAKEREGPR